MKTMMYAILAFMLCMVFSFWYMCPVLNNLPRPTGSYCVGYTHCNWYDNHLLQEINVEIFYSSIRSKDVEMQFPYQHQKMAALADMKAQTSMLPHYLWNCLVSNIFSYAEPNAPVVHGAQAFPVIVYLPGIGGENLHNVTCENLASQGYVVCAIIPAGDIAVAVKSDGATVPLNEKLQVAMKNGDRDAIYAYRNQAHVRWANLIESTLQKLSNINDDTSSQFFHLLDVHRLGMIGHSHGGAVVTDFCQKNKICKAGINMDGWTKAYNSDARFDTPFMFMLGNIKDMPEIQSFIQNNEKRSDFIAVTFEKLGHEAFTDYSMIKQPLATLLGIKPIIGGSNAIAQEKNMVVCFFDNYLKKLV